MSVSLTFVGTKLEKNIHYCLYYHYCVCFYCEYILNYFLIIVSSISS